MSPLCIVQFHEWPTRNPTPKRRGAKPSRRTPGRCRVRVGIFALLYYTLLSGLIFLLLEFLGLALFAFLFIKVIVTSAATITQDFHGDER